ncbi:hypothetical protein [Sulfurisphaera ohwakuensis]|uniref:Membrane protein implicated in regulation of membrane protease activity n=1 Tax=Sulfurisphaera ohwakuensis TaxID=69656 RepID=A0A650CG14_SULOH|nr:hypothetical protein [Sulfurisphaera ohwakuensis]MBB5255050.1 membrane protein implicated in regulation of membrane protease activity [Sulfurisphaera ohwakuensis]QGR16752.1 hypothetical protein D1869_05785 [Sulfurisphaera ohwakuensis]
MSLFSILFYTILPAIFLIAVIIIVYSGKIHPNLKIGIPILAFGIALIVVGIVIANPPLSIIGFFIFVISLIFMPRRHRW